MNDAPPLERVRRLSGDAWERLLTFHYLRSDGPSGASPLRSIDATPPELARATQVEGASPEAAKRSFVGCFAGVSTTREVLRGGWVPATRSDETPGYFRYLVLTTLVPALEPEDTASRNFRERLGELLDLGGPLSDLGGLPALWARLSGWCERRRADARPTGRWCCRTRAT